MKRQGRGSGRVCHAACLGVCRMINYTERISLLMEDVVRRTPRLSFIDFREVLVFVPAG